MWVQSWSEAFKQSILSSAWLPSCTEKDQIMMNRVRKMVFSFLRKSFWADYDPNETFSCGYCGKEMYKRYLFCSQACEDKCYGENTLTQEKYHGMVSNSNTGDTDNHQADGDS